MATSRREAILINEVDTMCGYYAARACMRSNQFQRVIGATRHPDSDLARELHDLGVEIRQYDPNQSEDRLRQIFHEAHAWVMIPVVSEDVAGPSRKLLQAAEKQQDQLKKVLLWSLLATGISEGHRGNGKYTKIFQQFHQVEEAFNNTKFQHQCILRIGFVSQQFLMLSKVLQDRGMFPLTSKSAKLAPVDLRDISKATVRVMTEHLGKPQDLHKQILTLTGPQAYNGPSLTQILNQAVGTQVQFQEVNLDELRDILNKYVEGGDKSERERFGRDLVLAWMELFHENKIDITTQDLEKVLGRKPSEIREFFQDNADSFRPHSNSTLTHGILLERKRPLMS